MNKKTTSIKIDPELWKQAKVKCVVTGEKLGEMLERLLRKELETKTEIAKTLQTKYPNAEVGFHHNGEHYSMKNGEPVKDEKETEK